jgi:hypothetical protein
MNIPILKFKITELEEQPKKLFRKAKMKEISYEISLEYNLDEDRFYYTDANKSIPTKKDLSRSIIMIYDIYKRYEKFNLKDNFILSENKLNQFLNNFFNCNNDEDDFYLKRMIFGSKPVNLLLINTILEELNITDVDYNKYYYYQYPIVNFR